MEHGAFKPVRFDPRKKMDFGATVRKRVAEYFKKTGKSQSGDYRIWIKVATMPLMYLVPFVVILTGIFSNNIPVFYSLWIMMGVGMAGCGLGIMHDANHGAISKKAGVNKFVGLILDFVGGYAFNWRIQHNVLHHSYTNIDGYDEDIDPKGVMRFSPHQPHKWFYRYQVYYAWVMYGLMTFSWVTYKDFMGLKRYEKLGLVESQRSTYKRELRKMIVRKILYYLYVMVLPIVLLDLAWWHIVFGWLMMHFTAGLILGLVFQPAHVLPETEFPLPDGENHVATDWASHQMRTTANFAPSNWILSWYVGGLNYQIEHHLFPNMCHVHHRAVSKIVRATAKEFNLPYHSNQTFLGAISNHWKMLARLGT